MRTAILAGLAGGLSVAVLGASAQTTVSFASNKKDSSSVVYIWHADLLQQQSKDSSQIQSLSGHVKLQEGKTIFYCDSVAMDQVANTIEAFGNVHINDNDSTDIYSQYMKYFVDKKQIDFRRHVTLTDGKGILTTEGLQYDMNDKVGTYHDGGKVVNGTTVVNSRDGIYFANSKDAIFKNDVVLKDPAYDLRADSLQYNSEQHLANFITLTHIRDSTGRTIETRTGFYDLANHRAHFGGRPTIVDSAQAITADDIHFDDSTGISVASGHAMFRDTVEGTTVIADLMIADKRKNTLFATQHPLMILKQEKADSLYVAADTLYSARLPDSLLNPPSDQDSLNPGPARLAPKDSSLRYLQAYHHVRIYSDSLQGLADSLFYNGKDSVFQLFRDPIVWAGGNQVTGDTMYLYTRNKQPLRLYVFENGMVTNRTGENMYNQVKANTLNAYFMDGNIDHMRARGNAESIYYIKDDSGGLVGVNRVNSAEIIDMEFLNRQVNRIILRSDPDATMFPIRSVNVGDMRLRNFKWLEAIRPKTKEELLSPSPHPSN
jgi:lipopolysaccharide export system protein LptA